MHFILTRCYVAHVLLRCQWQLLPHPATLVTLATSTPAYRQEAVAYASPYLVARHSEKELTVHLAMCLQGGEAVRIVFSIRRVPHIVDFWLFPVVDAPLHRPVKPPRCDCPNGWLAGATTGFAR
jgi:hypothetical protein